VPRARAVDQRGVLELGRQREEELPQQEHPEGERRRGLRHDQPLVGAELAELGSPRTAGLHLIDHPPVDARAEQSIDGGIVGKARPTGMAPVTNDGNEVYPFKIPKAKTESGFPSRR
jgi:hypothetical protein